MTAVQNHPNLALSIIATGAHFAKEFGFTANDIINDGFTIAEIIENCPEEDTDTSVAIAIGRGIENVGEVLKRIKPDLLLVSGDRYEILAGVIASVYMNIPVAHIHGGDCSRGGLDESARHAITKFAHIHFPATKKSGERILKLGEDPWRIFVVGAPAIDTILNVPLLSKEAVAKKYGLILNKPLIVVLQHSVTTEPQKAGDQMVETLEAIKMLKHETVIIYPNADAGGREIIKQIKEFASLPFIKTYKSLPQKDYLSLLKGVDVMVGNSSSGIIESSSFKLPVVNIGIRQEGRERSSNVIDVSHDRGDITKAIQSALYDKKFMKKVNHCKNPYGDGKAGSRIAERLSEIQVDGRLLQKKITY